MPAYRLTALFKSKMKVNRTPKKQKITEAGKAKAEAERQQTEVFAPLSFG